VQDIKLDKKVRKRIYEMRKETITRLRNNDRLLAALQGLSLASAC
jgi:hypothetical protein